MTVPARVSVVGLDVADVGRSSAFYRALGWPQSAASRDEIAFFKTAGALLAVYKAEALAAAGFAFPGGSPNGSRGALLAIHSASSEEVDGALKAARAAGASMVEPAVRGGGGEYPGYFADPDEHAFQVVWNPRFVLGADGRYALP